MHMSIVVVTHALESAFKIADRIMIIGDGGVRAIGALDEIRAHPDPQVQALLARRSGPPEVDGGAYLDRLTAAIDD